MKTALAAIKKLSDYERKAEDVTAGLMEGFKYINSFRSQFHFKLRMKICHAPIVARNLAVLHHVFATLSKIVKSVGLRKNRTQTQAVTLSAAGSRFVCDTHTNELSNTKSLSHKPTFSR